MLYNGMNDAPAGNQQIFKQNWTIEGQNILYKLLMLKVWCQISKVESDF